MSFGADFASALNDQLNRLGLSESQLVAEILTSILVLLAFVVIGWAVYHVFEKYFIEWAKKTKNDVDDAILANTKRPIYFLVFVLGLYYGLEFLSVLKPYSFWVDVFFTLIEIFLVAYIITRISNVLLTWYAARQKKKGQISDHIMFILKRIINFSVYLFAFLLILGIYEVDLSAAFVTLGVGGIAIAFALQSILSDMFGAFSIYFDRPFEIGDYVVVGEYGGTVQKIGMKSTRIKLLQGEELVLPNSVLTSQTVRNFKKMKKRRISFDIGVTYDTSTEKLKKIPDMVKEVVNNVKRCDVDRVHFKKFGDFSLVYEIVYYVSTQDYAAFMDCQQEINLGIREAFEKAKIEMAFPTQTIHLAK